MKKNILITVLLVISLGFIVFAACLYWSGKQKTVYILTEKVFAEYKGTKEVKKKITDTEEKQKAVLDSVYQQAILEKDTKDKTKALNNQEVYKRLYSGFAANNQKQQQQYNEDIWKQINQYLEEYGKEHNYSYILGATGNGNVMFADQSLNVTEEVIQYINQKYEGN